MTKLLKDIQNLLVQRDLAEGTTLFYKGKKYGYSYNKNKWIKSDGSITEYANYTSDDTPAILSEGIFSDIMAYQGTSFGIKELDDILEKHGYYIEFVSSWCFQLAEL